MDECMTTQKWLHTNDELDKNVTMKNVHNHHDQLLPGKRRAWLEDTLIR
jgi:hypothetical protein